MVSSNKNTQNAATCGFSLIEVLIAILLLSSVILIATGFILPLKVTKVSAEQTAAATYARSYIELLKVRWSDTTNYTAPTTGSPTISSNGSSADIEMPTGWDLTTNSTTWTTADNIRTVTVTVKPPQKSGESTVVWQSRWLVLSVLITRP